jgi:hypothetical protein
MGIIKTHPNLTVHLNGVPVDSPNWIVKLGENQYQYTIITTSIWNIALGIGTGHGRFYEKL